MRRSIVGFPRWVTTKTGLLLAFVGVATLCGVLVAALVVPLVGGLVYGTNAVANEVAQFPADLKVPSLDGRTYVYAHDNSLIATFFSQNRVYEPLAQIAPVMRHAMVDIEDERFYQHGAADPKGTLRALVNNSTTGTTQPGSTDVSD